MSAADCAKHIAQNGELNVQVEALFTAPPELAELQATIAQLNDEIAYLNSVIKFGE